MSTGQLSHPENDTVELRMFKGRSHALAQRGYEARVTFGRAGVIAGSRMPRGDHVAVFIADQRSRAGLAAVHAEKQFHGVIL